MKVDPKLKPRQATLQQWWYLAFVILIALPLVLSLVFSREIYNWYLREFVEPELEEALGFRGGEIDFPGRDDRTYRTYAVIAVRPGGMFEIAGVRPGDVPFGYVHGTRSGFIGHLNSYRGATLTFRVINREQARDRDWEERLITVKVPADGAV